MEKTGKAANLATNNIPTAGQIAPTIVPLLVPSPTGHPMTIYSNTARSPEVFHKYVESHNVPIDFYGRVIDQDSNALSGVKIKSAVRHWIMPDLAVLDVGTTEIPIERTTGADGRFEIHGVSGDGFGVILTKDGYDSEPGPRGFGGGTSGSYENPVIFKMWSASIHEHLISGDKQFQIVPDGRPYFINLADDTISETGVGDLKVWIQYTNQVVLGQLYDWSAGIEVINGGLIEEPLGIAMYEAPGEGYGPAFTLQQQIKGGQSGEIGNRSFYLLLENGQEYGRMKINLYAPYGHLYPGLIRLTYAINPSGSHILR
jgi:hypothetical protein